MVAITWERQKLRQQGLDIRLREEWDAQQDYTTPRDCEAAEAFFLHIAVVDDPSDLLDAEDFVARRVEAIGQSRFGSGMSYNALAFGTGRLYEGQPLTRRGTHTVNTFRRATCPVHGGSLRAPSWTNNVNAHALCLPQQVDDPVTDKQIDAAARWAAAQVRAGGLTSPSARWHGHRCVTAKGCPGETAYERIPELQRLTDRYVRDGLKEDDVLNPEDKKWIEQTVTKAVEQVKLDVGKKNEWSDDRFAEAVLTKLNRIEQALTKEKS